MLPAWRARTRRETRKIVGGSRQAGNANHRGADAPAGIVEIVQAQAVCGEKETAARLKAGLGHLWRVAVEESRAACSAGAEDSATFRAPLGAAVSPW